MKTELRSGYTSDEKGVAVFITLILLFVVTIAGLTILSLAGRDRIASSDMSSVRNVTEVANTALDACENQITQKSPLMRSVLNGYMKNKSHKWFFSADSQSANNEKKVQLGDGYSYSAEIMAYDVTNNLLQVRCIGYGRSNAQKSVVAQYRLNGLQKVCDAEIPRYALYLAGQARNFNSPLDIVGDVYIGRDFHFNSGAVNSNIHGYLKTGIDLTASLPSGIDAPGLSIDSGVFIGTDLRMNKDFTCNSRFGIYGNLQLDYVLKLMKEGWFNGTITGNGSVDMNNDTIHHSGKVTIKTIPHTWVTNYKYEHKDTAVKSIIAKKIGVDTTNDNAWGMDTTGLRAVAYELPSFIDGGKLNQMYEKCLTDARTDPNRMKNGYMVVIDTKTMTSETVQTDTGSDEFTGKAVFLINRPISINGKFPNMAADSRILIIAMNGAELNGFGGSGSRTFNGLVYLMGNARITTQAGGTYTINGAVHLADSTCWWTMNGNERIIFNFNSSVISEFVSIGAITIPARDGTIPPVKPSTLRLTDFKIRSEMLSVSY
jgi:Tfp pilus assembly protein PilX/CRISPR/Cas system CSM-associated protein Csm3 (group 7 of RAMP superfamily)